MNTYTEDYDRILKDGGWVAVPRAWTRVMTPAELLLVCHLINQGKNQTDDFVLATPRFLNNGISMWELSQAKSIENLIKKGFIEVRHGAVSEARSIKVCTEAIRQAVKEEGLEPKKPKPLRSIDKFLTRKRNR